MNVPIIGVVENMSYFKCGNCGEEHEIFKRIVEKEEAGTTSTSTFYDADGSCAREAEGEGVSSSSDRRRLPLLCRVPIAPGVCSASEAGTPVAVAAPESDAGVAFATAATKICEAVNGTGKDTTTEVNGVGGGRRTVVNA